MRKYRILSSFFLPPSHPSRFIYRGESGRSASDVKKEGGFQSTGKSYCIEKHLEGMSSQYISFSSKLLTAVKFAKGNWGSGTVYFTNFPEISVNTAKLPLGVTTSTLSKYYAQQEQEIVSIGPLGFENIYRWQSVVGLPGIERLSFFIGEPQKNIFYQPRNWTIQILSAGKEESQDLENTLRFLKKLNEKKRILTYEEAKLIRDTLKADFSHIMKEFSIAHPQLIIYKKIDRFYSSPQAIQKIINNYHSTCVQVLGIKKVKKYYGFFKEKKENDVNFQTSQATSPEPRTK